MQCSAAHIAKVHIYRKLLLNAGAGEICQTESTAQVLIVDVEAASHKFKHKSGWSPSIDLCLHAGHAEPGSSSEQH